MTKPEDRIAKEQDLVKTMRQAAAGTNALIKRIDELETHLRTTLSDLQWMKRQVGTSLMMQMYEGSSLKTDTIHAFLSKRELAITTVLP